MFEAISGNVVLRDTLPSVKLTCPHCRSKGIFYAQPNTKDVGWSFQTSLGTTYRTLGIRFCPNTECRGYVFVLLRGQDLIASDPPPAIEIDSSSLPSAIKSSLEEAVKCYSAGCYRASALMVRRTLEELCLDKKATGKNLKDKLAALKSVATLSNDLLDAADELRLLGNDAAHIESKDYDGIDKEELDAAIDLAKELLKAVYQHADLVSKLRALKKQPPTTP